MYFCLIQLFMMHPSQTVNKRSSLFAREPGAEAPARTIFETTFIPRQGSPKVIHSFKRPKPQPVARQIGEYFYKKHRGGEYESHTYYTNQGP